MDKDRAFDVYMQYMFDRTQSMFTYTGLPDTIPKRSLELYLQVGSHCVIAEHDGKLYPFPDALGGKLDPYYLPTIATVANPALNLGKVFDIGKDCAVVYNDSMHMGLAPMFARFATHLMEVDISLWRASVNSRALTLISGGDDATKKAADKFYKDLEAGEAGVVGSNSFLDSLKTFPLNASSASNYITQLIELRQYWLASWYQELGLNSNHNMKRESINESEAGMNEDALLPLVDDMLESRRVGLEMMNSIFGTNVSVDLSSSWKNVLERAEDEGEEDVDPGAAEEGGEEDVDGGEKTE